MSLLADVEMLKKASLPEVRETIAEKVAQYFNAGVFDEEEENIVFDIIRILAKDIEVKVRQTLAENIKENPKVPHDVVLRLAQDELDVAVPVLEFSTVLTEGDLVSIVRSANQVGKLIAISCRTGVTEVVSSALIHSRNEEVVVSLFNNKTSKISEESLHVALDEFRKKGSVVEVMTARGGLPVSVINKMVGLVSDEVVKKLKKEAGLSDAQAREMSFDTQKQVREGIISSVEAEIRNEHPMDKEEGERIAKMEGLVRSLNKKSHLTHSIILRYLCEGNIAFFEVSMAILAGIPIRNARHLIMDRNRAALHSLCKRAGTPYCLLEAVETIVDFVAVHDKEALQGSKSFKKYLMTIIMDKNYERTIPLMPYVKVLVGSKLNADDIVATYR